MKNGKKLGADAPAIGDRLLTLREAAELKRTNGDATLLRTVWRTLPRNGGRALLLRCFDCDTPRRHVCSWQMEPLFWPLERWMRIGIVLGCGLALLVIVFLIDVVFLPSLGRK
jgi:hypothetical protein